MWTGEDWTSDQVGPFSERANEVHSMMNDNHTLIKKDNLSK